MRTPQAIGLLCAGLVVAPMSAADDWQTEFRYGFHHMDWNPGGFSTSELEYNTDPIQSHSATLAVHYQQQPLFAISYQRSQNSTDKRTVSNQPQGSAVEQFNLDLLTALASAVSGSDYSWLSNFYLRYQQKTFSGEATFKRDTGYAFDYFYTDLSGQQTALNNSRDIHFSSRFSSNQLGYSLFYKAYALEFGLFKSNWKKPLDRLTSTAFESFSYELSEAEYDITGWEVAIKPVKVYPGVFVSAEIRSGMDTELTTYQTSESAEYQSATYGAGYSWGVGSQLFIQAHLTYNWSVFKFSDRAGDSDDESEVTAGARLVARF